MIFVAKKNVANKTPQGFKSDIYEHLIKIAKELKHYTYGEIVVVDENGTRLTLKKESKCN